MSGSQLTSHIALDVTNRDQSVELYESVFDMEISERCESETVLALGDARFYIQEAEQPNVYLDFEVQDLKRAIQRLENAGAAIEAVKTDEHGSSYMVTDPFGISFHLYECGLDVPS